MRALSRFTSCCVASALFVIAPMEGGRSQSVPASTAVPQGGKVAAGSATIQQGGTAANPVLTVNQDSDRAIINWQSFNIGSDASVQFQQPSVASVTMNRVMGSDPSSIFGRISSNGQVYLINPNGVYFSPSASADVGSLVATTQGMSDADFMAGGTTFSRNGATGKVVNEGTLKSRDGGYIALLAPEVRNAGVIIAKSGTIALAAGDAVTLNVDAHNSLTNLLVKPSTMQALVENQKIIKAPDGQVIVSAQAYNEIASGVINNSGEISAKGIKKSGGAIVLDGSTAVKQSGSIDVSSKNGAGGTVKLNAKTLTHSGSIKAESEAPLGTGGRITLTGDLLTLKAGSSISANGARSGGTVLVGGDWQGTGSVPQAKTVVMEQGASITANATQTGNGGKVVLWSDLGNANGLTSFDGLIEAKGANGGKGGQVETSGHHLGASGQVVTGQGGEWLLDPADILIGLGNSGATNDNGTPQTISPNSTLSSVNISASSISTALGTGDVVVTTTNTGTAGAGTGNITVSSAITGSTGSLSLLASGTITLNAGITLNGANKSLLVKANKDIVIANATSFQTNNGDMIFWSNATGGNTANGIAINTANVTGTNSFNTAGGQTGQATGGGRLVFAGGLDDGSNGGTANDGIPDGFAYSNAVTTAGLRIGVATISTSAVTMNSGGGDVIMRGQSTTAAGLVQYGGLNLKSGNGSITMTGTSTAGHGVDIASGTDNSLVNIISSAPTNAINISGTVTGSGNFYGTVFGYQANVSKAASNTVSSIALQSLGGGNITVTGRTAVGPYGMGVNDVSILANAGTITLDGGAKGINFQNYVYNSNTHQVTLGTCATCDATTVTALGLYTGVSTATVLLKGDLSFVYSNSTNLMDVTGAVSIQPSSANFTGNFDPSSFSYSANVTTLTVGSVGSTGNVTIAGLLAMTGGSATIYGGAISQSNGANVYGNINYYATSTFNQVGMTTSSQGNITITAGGALTTASAITASNGAITLQGQSLTTRAITSKNALSITATGATAANGTMTLGSYNIESTSGSVTLSAQSNISQTPTNTLKAATTVSITSASGSVGPGIITAGSISLSAAWMSTAAMTATTGSIDLNSAGFSTTGALSAATNLNISAGNTVTLSGNATITGNITIATTSGGLTQGTSTLTSSGGNIAITSVGNYSGGGAITASAGTVSLITSGLLTRTTGAGAISGANGVTLQSTTSSVTVTGATNSSAGSVSILGGGNVSLSSAGSTVSANNNVTITAANGNTSTNALITTTNGYVSLASGGGTNGLSTLAAVNSGGAITITAPGTLSLSALNLIAGGDVTLNSSGSSIFLTGGTIAKTNGTNDATVNLYASSSISSSATIYAGSSGANNSANGKLNVMFNPGRASTGASAGALTLSAGTIRTQGGNITAVGGTDQADYILGGVSGSYGSPGINLGGTNSFSIYSNGGNIKFYAKSSATAPSNSSGAIYIQGGLTLDSGAGSIVMNGVGQAQTFAGIYSYCNSCFGGNTLTSTSGDISLIGATSATNVSAVNLYSVAGKVFAINSASGNIYINGENTTTNLTALATPEVTLPSTTTVTATAGSVILQGKAANGYLSYTQATQPAITNSANITAGTRILVESDGDLSISAGKLTAPDIDIVTRTTSGGFGTTTLVPGTGRVLVYVSTASNYAPANSNPTGTGVTFSHYGSTCTFPGTISCQENSAAVLPTTNGTILVAGTAASPSFNLYNGKTSPVVGLMTNSTLTYGASSFQQTLTSSSNATITYASTNTAVATVSANGTVTIVGAGSATITATQTGNIYYNTASGSYAVTVNQAPLTVTANGLTKTYDGTSFSGGNGVTITGFVNGQTSSVLGGTLAYTGTSQGASNAGSYLITPSGYTSTNYSLSYVGATLTINKADAVVIANSDTYTYNGLARTASGFTAYGLANGQTSSVLTGVSVSGGGTNAGTYTVTASGTSPNYNLSFVNGTMTIDKAPATVTANSSSVTYDGQAHTGSGFSVTGLVNGQAASVLTGVSVSGGGTNAGSYAVTASGTDSNYRLSFVDGTLTINKAALTVTANGDIKTYDGAAYSGGNGVTYSGFVNGETSAVLGGSLGYTGSSQGAINAGAYAITPSGLTASNYAITFVDGALTVNKAPLTVTASNDSKTYDGQIYSGGNGVAYSGFVNGESSSVLTGTLAYSGSSQAAVNAGSYAITPTGLSANNYDITYASGTLTVGKASAVVTVNSDNYVYNGQARLASGFTATGLVNGETPSVLTGVSLTGGGTNAGNYTASASGTDTNYNLTFVNGTMTIAKAPLTIRAVDDGKFITQTDLVGFGGVSYTGLVNGETAQVLTTAPTVTRSNAGVEAIGTYSGVLQASGASAANYDISYVSGSYTIVPAGQLLVKVAPASQIYGGSVSYTIASAQYLDANSVAVSDLTSRTAVTGGNAVSMTDGYGGSAAFTIGPTAAAYSTSGLLKAGGYNVGATSVSVTSSHFSNQLTVVGSLQVDQAPVTASVGAASKVYDGALSAGTVSLTVSGALAGDAFSGSGLGTFDNKNVGTGKGITASSLALSGADASNYYIVNTTATGSSGTITRKAITVSGIVADDKVYDGNRQAVVDYSAAFLSGLVVGDTLSVSATGTFADKNVGAGKTVTLTSQYSGADAGNYSITSQATTTASITPKSLTLSGITAADKVYDGTRTAVLDGSLAVATGLVAGDRISVSASGDFDSRNVGSGKLVSVTTSLSGTDAGNYVIAGGQTTTTASITPATLTVSGSTGVNKTYDGTVALLAGVTGYSAPLGLIGSDSVSVTGAPVYSTANAGSASLHIGTVALSGADAGNYTLQWVNGSGTIAKANATVTGNSSSMTYDGTLHVATGFTVTGLVNGETASVLTGVTAAGSGKNAGSYAVTPTGTDSNYNLTFVDGTFTINKANLTVTANTDSKTYSGLQYSGGNGVTYSGFVASETSADLSGGLVYGGTAQGALNAGSYVITPSGLLSHNYSISYQSAALTINKAALQVIVNPDAKFITQSDTAGYSGVSYSGFVNGETASVLTATPTIARSNAGVENHGTYTGVLQASGADAQNYTISYVAGDYTIVPAGQLLVKMNPVSQIYGNALSYSVASAQYLDLNGNGIIDLQSNASVTGTSVSISDGVGGTANFSVGPSNPALSTSGNVNAGHYAIDATGISNTSTNFSNNLTVLGHLDVSAAAVSGAVNATSKTYDGSVAAGTTILTLTGLVSGDTVSASGNGLYADKNVGSGKSVTVSGLALSGADAQNYYLTNQTSTGLVGTITPKTIIVSEIAAANKTYDKTTSATVSTSAAKLDGLVAGDDVTVSATGSFATATAGANKTVTLTSSYGGQDLGNYSIIDQATTFATIAQKTVTLTGSSGVTRAYTGTRDMAAGVSGYGSLSGVIAGDTVSTTGSAVFAGSDAGTHALEQGSAALTGADSGNYVLAWVDGSGSITKAALTIRAQDASKTYDGLAYSGGNGVTYTGLVNNETSAVLGGSVSYAGTSRGAINAGTYSIKASGLTSSNYDITFADGSLTVNKAAATVTAETASYTYNGLARQATGFTVTGLVNGETSAVLTGVSVSGSGTNAGSYTTSASGTDSNYNLTFVNGTMTINKAQATVTAASDHYVYNGLNRSASGFSVTGLVNGETSAVLTGVSVSGGGTNAGSYATSASGTDSNYDLTFVNGSMTIGKAPLTVTALNTVKTYDGLAFSGGNGVSYAGLVNNETSAVLGGALSYGGTSQGAINADLYRLTASGLTSSNYNITYNAGSLAVWKASATVTAASDIYTYNGQTRTVSGFTVTGLVNGETSAVLTGVSVTGSGTNAGTYTTTASGGDSNYALTFVDGTMTINKATLTVTAANDNKTYNGQTYSGGNGVSYSGFVNNETSAVLGGSVAYSGSSQNAKNAGTYAITPSGLSSGNYDIAYVDGALTVGKAAATVTASSDIYTYNGLNRSASGFTATGLVNGETKSVLTGVSVSGGGTNAGTYTTSASGTDTNYDLTFVDGTMTINKAALTVTAVNDNKTYNGQTYSGGNGVSYNGLVNNETSAVLGGSIAYSGSSQGAKNAGTYTITPSGLTSSNYDIIYADGSMVVAKATATVTAASDIYTYNGQTRSASGFSVTGLVNNETSAVLTGVSVAGSGRNAGTYTTTASGTDGNYDLAFVNGTITINKAALTVTAANDNKTYNGQTYSGGNGVSYAGFVNSETASVLSGTLGYSGSSQNAKNAGSYVITPTGLSSGNYDITYASGTLTVGKASAVVTAKSDIYTYNGQSRTETGFTATGLASGDTVAALSGVTVSGGGTNVGTYTTSASGTDSNYNLTFVNGSMTIQPKLLTAVGATVAGRDYDGTRALSATTGTLSGLIGTESLGVTVVATAASKNAGTQTATLAYSLTDGSNGGLASNYMINDASLSVVITPKTLTATGTTVSDKTYDGTRMIASTAGSLSGMIGSETLSVSSTATADSKNAGSQTATVVYSLADGSNGGLATNYALASTTHAVTISQKDLTVTGTRVASKTFDGRTDATVSGGSLVGLISGDQVSLSEAGSFASSTVGQAVPVVMNDQISGVDAANYRLLQPQGVTGSINANTPIIYPSPPPSSPMVNQPTPPTTPSTGTGVGGGWSVEVNATSSSSTISSATTSPAAAQTSTGGATSSVVIKANSESGSIQNGPDYLNVGRAVIFDAAQGNPVIVGATISFAKGFEPGRTLLELNALAGIKAQIDNDSGKIILTGSASVSDYNRVVQTLRMKLNGGDNRRVVAMNLSLVDQIGNRETRLITLKPFEAGSQAEIKLRLPVMATPEATLSKRDDRLGAVMLPNLPSAQIHYR